MFVREFWKLLWVNPGVFESSGITFTVDSFIHRFQKRFESLKKINQMSVMVRVLIHLFKLIVYTHM